MRTIPNKHVELLMVRVDRDRKYTDDEIVKLMDTMPGYGSTDDWEHLESCATDPKVKRWCRDRWHSAYHAEEMICFDEI